MTEDNSYNEIHENNKHTESVPQEIGNVKIADEVLSIVASLAAREVDGVLSMSGGFAEGLNEFLGSSNISKGVRITVEGRVVNAELYINIEYGACIPEVALEVQERVREAIKDMTGYEVKQVNVHIQGVQRRKKTDLEKTMETV